MNIFLLQKQQFTNNWAPPEAFIEPIRLSTASDVFSFGMIVFEVLTGTIPWIQTNEYLIPNHLLEGELVCFYFANYKIKSYSSQQNTKRQKTKDSIRITSKHQETD